MRKSLFLILLLILSFQCLFSQRHSISDKEANDTMFQFNKALDDLLNTWYMSKAIPDTNIEKLNKYNFRRFEVPAYSDEVYIKRLLQLNSPIPLKYNDPVRRYIDLYTIRRRDQVERMLGLSIYYFPIFEAELDRQGMPLELKFIPVIESALNTHAVSKSGATGLWQFMYKTARLYKFKITSYVDERRDPYKATEIGVKYYKDLYQVYKDWLLVIAAYNCGPGNVNKAIRKSNYKTDFWDVYPYLPRETRGYIPAFIAANYAMNYYVEHNLYPREIYCPGVLDTILIGQRLDFRILAKILEMPIEELREYNPQYTRDIIPQSFSNGLNTLRIPIEKSAIYYEKKDLIYRYQDLIEEKIKEQLSSLKKIETSQSFKSENTNNFKPLTYKVKSGDKLAYIADWYDCSISDIKRWNRLKGNEIVAGRSLCVYVPADQVDNFRNVNNLSFEQKQLQANNTPYVHTKSSSGKVIYYIVQRGDTFWKIAQKYPGVTVNEIMRLNNISHSNSLKPGQKIKIRLRG